MPARAHRRAPDHLAGAVPNPPCRGLALYGPPPKPPVPGPPGRWPPSTPPFPPSRSANWRIRKIAISSAPSRGPLHRPPWGEGACSEAPPPLLKRKVPPRACTPGLAPRAPASPPLHFTCPPPRPPVRPTPPPRQLAPHAPPSQGREAPPAALARGWGGGTAGGAWLRGDRRAGGVVPRGSPCQGPHLLRACLRGRAPRRPPGRSPPSTLQPRPTTPDNDDAISPTPSRGPLHRPPSPGGEGAGSTVPSIKDPASPPAWKGCPLDPRSGAPGQAVERTGESPKVTISSPNPRGGGGALHRPYWQRGHALHYPPLKRPAPRTARKACPFDPPRFDPRPSRRANWPIPKGTISLPRARGLANDPPAGGTWLSSAYHPKPRRQIDRDGATPAKEGATLLGKTKAPGPIAPPPPASGNPPHAPSANWRRGI
ncbi:hypothetical protein N7530_012913 [Penicillium desertorum]|uniref:Uncharacterized protein n=1 Tax=Penicillium desertorum TaxID=1303715 RepID=A0A9X0BFE0_9EURO|nr:hypothetical protein N7530_012913 [Penicillium desertorum]